MSLRVAAPPADDEANAETNAETARFFSGVFEARKSGVEVLRGDKTILIKGVSQFRARRVLSECL